MEFVIFSSIPNLINNDVKGLLEILELKDSSEARLMIETLNTTLNILSPTAKELVIELMQVVCGVSIVPSHSHEYPSKGQIEAALIKTLGSEFAYIIIEDWNKRIMKAGLI